MDAGSYARRDKGMSTLLRYQRRLALDSDGASGRRRSAATLTSMTPRPLTGLQLGDGAARGQRLAVDAEAVVWLVLPWLDGLRRVRAVQAPRLQGYVPGEADTVLGDQIGGIAGMGAFTQPLTCHDLNHLPDFVEPGEVLASGGAGSQSGSTCQHPARGLDRSGGVVAPSGGEGLAWSTHLRLGGGSQVIRPTGDDPVGPSSLPYQLHVSLRVVQSCGCGLVEQRLATLCVTTSAKRPAPPRRQVIER